MRLKINDLTFTKILDIHVIVSSKKIKHRKFQIIIAITIN
jgi:hypothetical protein